MGLVCIKYYRKHDTSEQNEGLVKFIWPSVLEIYHFALFWPFLPFLAQKGIYVAQMGIVCIKHYPKHDTSEQNEGLAKFIRPTVLDIYHFALFF